jgi:hypothetical protein
MDERDERDEQPETHPFDEPAAEQTAAAMHPEIQEGAAPQLALDEDERLPWLESADDDDDAGAVDTARLMRFLVFGVVLLAAIIGGLWLVGHRTGTGPQVADGSVIKAPAEPYKQVPAKTGGKTYAGTGDSAFAVSEGKTTQARLGGGEAPVPSPTIDVNAADSGDANGAAGGVGVQVGAYKSQADAEAGWTRLSGGHDALKGVKHRILQGTADIGTVFRLQAIAPDPAAANALCSTLKASGVACQVKG